MTDAIPTASGINPSASYYRMEKLDLDSWFKVTQIDYERLIEQYPPGVLFDCSDNTSVRLLDLGCGTARFTSLLDQKMSDGIHVYADLLDISKYCLDSAVAKYHALKHFSPAVTYLSPIEDLPQSVDRNRRFDVIWAIHSLYTVNREKMTDAYLCCLDLLKPNGKFFIYQCSQKSSYYQLYDYYIAQHPAPNSTTNMLASEDHQQILRSLGITYEIQKLRFAHTIASAQQYILAGYLKKCILDNDVDVLEFFRPVLNEHFDPDHAQYRFDQEVDFLIINK